MPFGHQPGPPASASQLRELVALLQAEGYDGFRDARGPMGFTQRQAGGKFTRDEATACIDRLQEGQATGEAQVAPRSEPRLSAAERAARALSTEQLAAELQRRGWIVMEP